MGYGKGLQLRADSHFETRVISQGIAHGIADALKVRPASIAKLGTVNRIAVQTELAGIDARQISVVKLQES